MAVVLNEWHTKWVLDCARQRNVDHALNFERRREAVEQGHDAQVGALEQANRELGGKYARVLEKLKQTQIDLEQATLDAMKMKRQQNEAEHEMVIIRPRSPEPRPQTVHSVPAAPSIAPSIAPTIAPAAPVGWSRDQMKQQLRIGHDRVLAAFEAADARDGATHFPGHVSTEDFKSVLVDIGGIETSATEAEVHRLARLDSACLQTVDYVAWMCEYCEEDDLIASAKDVITMLGGGQDKLLSPTSSPRSMKKKTPTPPNAVRRKAIGDAGGQQNQGSGSKLWKPKLW